MLARRWRPILLAGLLLPAVAQAAGVRAPYLSLERYGLDEGLSQLAVTSIVEDDAGFLWVGTQEGLNRFDGQRFVVQRRPVQGRAGLVSSSIDSLAMDARSRLWIGTNDAGLEVLDLRSHDRRRVGQREELSHRTVRAMLLDGEAGAWLGTDRGIDYVDAQVRGARRLGLTAPVVAMARVGDTNLALDSACGLWRLHADRRERVALDTPGLGRCIGMAVAQNGAWLADAAGELRLVSAQGELLRRLPRVEGGGSGAELTALLLRQDDELLLGHADGSLARVGLERGAQVEPLVLDQPVGSAIQTIYQDRAGVIWLGTHTRGLFRARPLSAAVRRDLVDDADIAAWPSRSVRSIWRGESGELVGTDAGLAWRTGPGEPWRSVPELGVTSVRAIVPAADGGWWLGTHRGLWRLHGDGAAVQLPLLPDPRVTDLLAEGQDLWIATRGGLVRLTDGEPNSEGVPPALSGVFLTSLMRDDGGRLWVGSNERGLFRIGRDGSMENLSPDNGRLPHNSVWSLHGDVEAWWVGTFAGGLVRIDRGTDAQRVFSSAEGLSNDVVYRILPDRHGRLWLSTNNGLSVFDPLRNLMQALGPGDGLRNREYNSGAGFVDASGRLFFGGTEGLDVLEPDGLDMTSPRARPVLAGLSVIGQRRSAIGEGDGRRFDTIYSDRVQLDHKDSVLSLDMVAIDFTAPDAARLRYRIAGIHDDWVATRGPHADLMLSQLSPGDYPLEIAAAGRDGRFGPPRRLVIEVPPPAWRHPLAYLGYVLLLLALFTWLGTRAGARVRLREERIALLNRTVAERTAELERANQLLQSSNRELEEATRTDPLTHVSNRRDLQQWLAREGMQIVRDTDESGQARGVVFFMIDIDDFKRINDSHGHQVGDEVLVAFAARLSALSRGRDVVVRWGGEEFLWMLRDLHLDAAAAVAERARRIIADEPFRLSSGQSLPVTCSIGFAPWPFTSRFSALGDWEQSVNLADRALYAAKASGKNAWVGLVPGPAIDRPGLQALLANAPPGSLPEGAVQVLHSTRDVPVFPAG